MANPLFNQLNQMRSQSLQNSLNNNMVSQMMQQFNKLQNPMSDPQVAEMVKIVNQSGMTAQELFYQKAKEMGVDPNSILSQIGMK